MSQLVASQAIPQLMLEGGQEQRSQMVVAEAFQTDLAPWVAERTSAASVEKKGDTTAAAAPAAARTVLAKLPAAAATPKSDCPHQKTNSSAQHRHHHQVRIWKLATKTLKHAIVHSVVVAAAAAAAANIPAAN